MFMAGFELFFGVLAGFLVLVLVIALLVFTREILGNLACSLSTVRGNSLQKARLRYERRQQFLRSIGRKIGGLRQRMYRT